MNLKNKKPCINAGNRNCKEKKWIDLKTKSRWLMFWIEKEECGNYRWLISTQKPQNNMDTSKNN